MQKCFDDYEPAKLEACWRCLTRSMHGILEDAGGNEYSRHSGDRVRARQGLEPVYKVDMRVVKEAERAADKLQKELRAEKVFFDDDADAAGCSTRPV